MESLKGKEAGLVYRLWEPSVSCASLVLVHGLGAHSGRWEALAEYFVRNNISSCAIDLKGFGLSKDYKGHTDSFGVYFDDIRRLTRVARELHPEKKVFCIGESMGALLVYLLGLKDPTFCDGLILISPAFTTKVELTPWDYLRVFAPLFYNPRKQFDLPFVATLLTRDVAYQKKIETDDRECRVATTQLLTRIVFAQLHAYFSKKQLHLPILFLLAGDDRIVDTESSKKMFQRLKEADKEMVVYEGMFHALSIDIGKEKIFEDILKWITKRI
jgi:alpha-beta hydrolase superfamily lysophospholipase